MKTHASIYFEPHIPKKPFRPLSAPIQVLSSVTKEFEGRKVSCSQFVEDNPKTRYKGLKPSDFCIENQQFVGVQPSLAKYSFSTNEIDFQISQANELKFEQNGK